MIITLGELLVLTLEMPVFLTLGGVVRLGRMSATVFTFTTKEVSDLRHVGHIAFYLRILIFLGRLLSVVFYNVTDLVP